MAGASSWWALSCWSPGLGRTWGQSHCSGLQKWLQSLQLRWHNSCCTLTAGNGTTSSSLWETWYQVTFTPWPPFPRTSQEGTFIWALYLSEKGSCVCPPLIPVPLPITIQQAWPCIGDRRDVCSVGGSDAINPLASISVQCSEHDSGAVCMELRNLDNRVPLSA